MLQYLACSVFANFGLIHMLCKLTFGTFHDLSLPSVEVTLIITAKSNAALCFHSLQKVATMLTVQLPSEKDTAIKRNMDHLRSHRAMEMSITAAGTAPQCSFVQHQWCIHSL